MSSATIIQANAAMGVSAPATRKGTMRSEDLSEEFVEAVLQLIEVPALKPLKVVADTGNGMVGPILQRVYARLPVEFIGLYLEPDGSLPVTDVNPRFGGAFPLPLAAGSRYPEIAIALARGESPEPHVGEFRDGVLMTRFFSDLCLVEDETGELVPFAEELPHPIAAEPGQ